jgi:hypothetical protein
MMESGEAVVGCIAVMILLFVLLWAVYSAGKEGVENQAQRRGFAHREYGEFAWKRVDDLIEARENALKVAEETDKRLKDDFRKAAMQIDDDRHLQDISKGGKTAPKE